MKRNSSAMSLKKLVPKLLRSNSMKNLFKHKKPRAPVEIVRDTRRMLLYVHSESDEASPKHCDKVFLSIHAFASSFFTYNRMFLEFMDEIGHHFVISNVCFYCIPFTKLRGF